MSSFLDNDVGTNRWIWWLLLAGMLSVGLFVPASFIYWSMLWMGVLGWLSILWMFSQKGVASFIVGLIILIPVGLVGGFFLITVIPFLLAMLWPSAINIVGSLLFVSYLPLSGMPKFIGFMAISSILGFNISLPSAFHDLVIGETGELQISKALELSADDFLSVESNIKKIIFHNPKRHELLDLEGSEGCGCGYWKIPGVMEEDIERILQEEGLRYKIDKAGSGKNRLVINAVSQFGVTQLDISLYQGAEKLASYKRQLRAHYPFEPWTIDNAQMNSRDLDSLDMRIYFLAQSNFWNLLASMPSRVSQKFKYSRENANESLFPLSYFLQHTISNKSRSHLGAIVQESILTSELIPDNKLDAFNNERELLQIISHMCSKSEKIPEGDRYEIKPGYKLSARRYEPDLLFEFDKKSLRAAPKWHGIGGGYCTESSYVVISHPANEKHFFVYEYSIDGNLLSNNKIELPPIKGKWRKIQSLRNYIDAYVFELVDMENDREIATHQLIAHKTNQATLLNTKS